MHGLRSVLPGDLFRGLDQPRFHRRERHNGLIRQRLCRRRRAADNLERRDRSAKSGSRIREESRAGCAARSRMRSIRTLWPGNSRIGCFCNRGQELFRRVAILPGSRSHRRTRASPDACPFDLLEPASRSAREANRAGIRARDDGSRKRKGERHPGAQRPHPKSRLSPRKWQLVTQTASLRRFLSKPARSRQGSANC